MLRSPTVPPDLLPHARRAVAACPVMALRLNRLPAPPPNRPLSSTTGTRGRT
ncbi:ferredoxin [Streptomyces hokutonensis]|uniref:ferredoxin n=1 Tax=Streptomyces hokutonensis TaxID=1306990 RepID=UPI0033E63AE0